MSKIIMIGMMLLLASLAWAESQEEKIKELEEKIERLEKQLAAATQNSETAQIEELRRQVAILAEEVEKLRSGESTELEADEAQEKTMGLGVSAASVYRKKQGPSIAGYGEMLYENFSSETDAGFASGETDQIDFLRAVVYLGYRFNDRFLFNSEIEFEHAKTEGGEVAVEFAYIDYLMRNELSLRGGMVLIPMGIINEFHEPTQYIGTHRPLTETFIIPSTWRENGAGALGRAGMFYYRAYLIAGLNAAEFTSQQGLREGRQEGGNSKLDGAPAFVGRLDVSPIQGLTLGTSLFAGDSGLFESSEEEKERIGEPQDDFNVPTRIFEIHGEYKQKGVQLRGLYSHASLDHVAELNNELGFTGEDSVGDSMDGGYFEVSYDVLSGKSEQAIIPYVRFEKINTQSSVPSGFLKDPANDQTLWTFGLEYKPIPNIVIKADYENFDNEANSGIDQFSVLLGYSF
jgi:hypothetical protein